MEHFYKNLGEEWFDYPDLYEAMVKTMPSGSHFVEVGVWKGMSAAYMAVEIINSGKDIKFDCVDNWEQIDPVIADHLYVGLYETFLSNIKPVEHVVNPVRSISWEAASLYEDESLDFVFIDASHDYESVLKDITAWHPKVKKGGVIAGHDYVWCEGVQTAVKEYFQEARIEAISSMGSCWVVYN